jgi:hypothetical protein
MGCTCFFNSRVASMMFSGIAVDNFHSTDLLSNNPVSTNASMHAAATGGATEFPTTFAHNPCFSAVCSRC